MHTPPLLFSYLNYQFPFINVFVSDSFEVPCTEASDGVLVEQMTNTSDPPPYDPERFLNVTLMSSSCHSKNLFSVIVIFIGYYYHRYIPPPHPIDADSVGHTPLLVIVA